MVLPIPRGYAKQVVREIIDARFDAVKQNPGLIEVARWGVSNVYYNARKRLDAEGYDVSPLNNERTGQRKALYHYVKEYCDKIVYCIYCDRVTPRKTTEGLRKCGICGKSLHLGIKRHEIGIFPADRAILYFQGKETPINFKNYKQLGDLGTDVLCVEKEDTATKLEPFTRMIGIALLQSRGFIAEAGEWLAQEAAEWGANVIILTDFDHSGIELAFQIQGVTRLGVDLDTIEWLNNHRGDSDEVLDPIKLQERCTENSHWKHLKLVLGHDIPELRYNNHATRYIKYLQKQTPNGEHYIDFLRNKRIELNTIINEVGAQRFWEWVKSQLLEQFPNRDYNRAIITPRYILTPIIKKFGIRLVSTFSHVLEDKVIEIKQELRHTKGLLNTNEKSKLIEKRLRHVLSKHPLTKEIDLGVKALDKQIVDYWRSTNE